MERYNPFRFASDTIKFIGFCRDVYQTSRGLRLFWQKEIQPHLNPQTQQPFRGREKLQHRSNPRMLNYDDDILVGGVWLATHHDSNHTLEVSHDTDFGDFGGN